ncbi:MAG: hypothetical protein K2Y39_25355 [Candidatus Obscuribacterales bacterium]|nr:hypothetical protein [Candidatus Obscuribacterales bacterium]
MFPKVGDITNAEVISAEKTYAIVELDCGYTACLPGRGYIEGEVVEVRVTGIEESRRAQPNLTIEAV